MIVAALAILIGQTAPKPVDPCAYDRSAMLALPHETFDQDQTGGWRRIADIDGCEAAAADLIAEWRTENWSQLQADQLHLNYWHEGQLRAASEDRVRAVPLFLAGVNPDGGDPAKAEYALATVAFLNNDRPALEAARARMSALPMPPEFAQAAERYKATYGRELSWPLNLDVVDGLIACFGETYSKAYGDCRPGPD